MARVLPRLEKGRWAKAFMILENGGKLRCGGDFAPTAPFGMGDVVEVVGIKEERNSAESAVWKGCFRLRDGRHVYVVADEQRSEASAIVFGGLEEMLAGLARESRAELSIFSGPEDQRLAGYLE